METILISFALMINKFCQK